MLGSRSLARTQPPREEALTDTRVSAPEPRVFAPTLRVSVVVPAYNEAALIQRTLHAIPPWITRVIVVDDGSRDGTCERVRALRDPRVELVRLHRNRGVGAAIAAGYHRAFARGADIAVVMAGDAQMDPRDLPALLAPILAGEADYAKGDRLSERERRRAMPWTRRVGNRALSALTRALVPLAIRDAQCGYTAISRAAYQALSWEQLWPRYGYPNDLLAMLSERALRVREVPVSAIYADEKSGVNAWHALVIVPAVLLRARLRRLRPNR